MAYYKVTDNQWPNKGRVITELVVFYFQIFESERMTGVMSEHERMIFNCWPNQFPQTWIRFAS